MMKPKALKRGVALVALACGTYVLSDYFGNRHAPVASMPCTVHPSLESYLSGQMGDRWKSIRPVVLAHLGADSLLRCIDVEALKPWEEVRQAVVDAALGSGWHESWCVTTSMSWRHACGPTINYDTDASVNPQRKSITVEDKATLDALVESINSELASLSAARCFELYRCLERYLKSDQFFRAPSSVRAGGSSLKPMSPKGESVLYSDYIAWGGWEVALILTAIEFPRLADYDRQIGEIVHYRARAVAQYIETLP